MTWTIRPMNVSDIENVYAIETSVHIAPWSKSILRDCVLVGYNCLVLETKIENHWILGGYIIFFVISNQKIPEISIVPITWLLSIIFALFTALYSLHQTFGHASLQDNE